MKQKLIALALAAITAAGSAQAAELPIADYSLVPDGTEIGSAENDTDSQVTQLNTSSLGTPVLTSAHPDAYFVTTLNFGAGTAADMYVNFLASGKQRRIGVQVSNAGAVKSFGTGGDITAANLGPMAGQSVTVIAKLVYGAGSDTMTLWVNPTFSSLESAGDGSVTWNSNSFYYLRQRIDNNSTPATEGTSSIANTRILIDGDATFHNALEWALGGPTSPGNVSAFFSTVSASPIIIPPDRTTTSTIIVTLRNGLGVPVPDKTVTDGAVTWFSFIQYGGNPQAAIGADVLQNRGEKALGQNIGMGGLFNNAAVRAHYWDDEDENGSFEDHPSATTIGSSNPHFVIAKIVWSDLLTP